MSVRGGVAAVVVITAGNVLTSESRKRPREIVPQEEAHFDGDHTLAVYLAPRNPMPDTGTPRQEPEMEESEITIDEEMERLQKAVEALDGAPPGVVARMMVYLVNRFNIDPGIFCL